VTNGDCSPSDGRYTANRLDFSTVLPLDKVTNLTAPFRGKILCFPSCLFFPSVVLLAYFLFPQSSSRCFLLVSFLSHSIPFSLCVVMGSADLGWSFMLTTSRFVSLDKKVGWLIVFHFFPLSYALTFFAVSTTLAFAFLWYSFLHLCDYFDTFILLDL
jgi:hypothetical protein